MNMPQLETQARMSPSTLFPRGGMNPCQMSITMIMDKVREGTKMMRQILAVRGSVPYRLHDCRSGCEYGRLNVEMNMDMRVSVSFAWNIQADRNAKWIVSKTLTYVKQKNTEQILFRVSFSE